MGLLLNGAGDLVTKEKEKAKVLNAALSHPSILSPVSSAFWNARLLSEGQEQGRLTLAREGSGYGIFRQSGTYTGSERDG